MARTDGTLGSMARGYGALGSVANGYGALGGVARTDGTLGSMVLRRNLGIFALAGDVGLFGCFQGADQALFLDGHGVNFSSSILLPDRRDTLVQPACQSLGSSVELKSR